MFRTKDINVNMIPIREKHDTELCHAMVNVIRCLSLPFVPTIVMRPFVNSDEYCLESRRTLSRCTGFFSDVITFGEGSGKVGPITSDFGEGSSCMD